ncbi:MAG: HEPN domain-containing protein [Brevinematia bacterium]
MEEIVKKWITKAENDLNSAKNLIETKKPITDSICFHSQQCVEKYLKAFLTFHHKPFRKTHDIAELIENCKEIDPEFENLYDINIDNLTIYAVELRYPDDFYIPTLQEAKEALEMAEKTREFVLEKLAKLGYSEK